MMTPPNVTFPQVQSVQPQQAPQIPWNSLAQNMPSRLNMPQVGNFNGQNISQLVQGLLGANPQGQVPGGVRNYLSSLFGGSGGWNTTQGQ